MVSFKTGYAEEDIELIIGMDMTGFLARESNSAGIHDNLKIKCILFDDGITKFVLVVCDLLGLNSQYTRGCICEVAKRLSISADNIVITSIHTHSGPASIFLQDCGEVDENWLEGLKLRIVECAAKAADNVKPSKLAFKTSSCDIGINRVVKIEKLKSSLVDKQVGILEISEVATGIVKSILVNYACHPVTLTEDNLLYSADYPYFMIQAMQKREKYKTSSVIFANGCCGDINPSERGSFSISERLGQKLSDRITDASFVQIGENEFSDSRIILETLKVCIPLNNVFAVTEAEGLECDYSKVSSKETQEKDHVASKVDQAFTKWRARMFGMKCSGILNNFVTADIKIVQIGKLTIVALPFEVFHQIGLKIKDYFDPDRTMVLGYANGDYGYFPSKELYDESAYEARMAFKYYGHPGPVSKDAEDILLQAIYNHKSNCN